MVKNPRDDLTIIFSSFLSKKAEYLSALPKSPTHNILLATIINIKSIYLAHPLIEGDMYTHLRI
jgi:hypothetical protein